MSHIIREFFHDLLESLREGHYERLDEAVWEEKNIGIQKTTAALCEAGVEDEKIISLLQKHWDLRLSEAGDFLRQERPN